MNLPSDSYVSNAEFTVSFGKNSPAKNKVCDCCVDTCPIDDPNVCGNSNKENPPSNLNITKLVSDEIVNLSTHKLTGSEESILRYGLNFCPTPGIPERGEIIK